MKRGGRIPQHPAFHGGSWLQERLQHLALLLPSFLPALALHDGPCPLHPTSQSCISGISFGLPAAIHLGEKYVFFFFSFRLPS